MTANARTVSLAKSSSTDIDTQVPIAVVAYASHDLTDAEATRIFEDASIANDPDSHRLAMRWADSKGSDAIFASIEGRYLVDAYDRRRIAADRFARVITRAKGWDPGAYAASADRDNIAEYVHRKLVDSDEDADVMCSSLDYFLSSLEPGNLLEILPEFDHEQSLILGALLRHAGTTVKDAVEIEGPCDGGWSKSEVGRSLDIHIELWQRRHAEIAIVTSDEYSARHFVRPQTVASVSMCDERKGAALRLAEFIASVTAVGDSHTDAPSPGVMASILRHGTIETRSREAG